MCPTKLNINFGSYINISVEHMHIRIVVLTKQLECTVACHVDLHNPAVIFIGSLNSLMHQTYERGLFAIHFNMFVGGIKF